MRQRFARLAIAAAAAVTAGLVFASPAQAADVAVLNPAHVGKMAGFQEECTGPFASLPAGYDGWHFLLPTSSGSGFTSVTLTFSSPSGTVIVGPITSTDPTAPTTAGDNSWYGYIDNAGSSDKHLYVFTLVGWTLTGGTAEVTDVKAGATFNLSHTCKGTGTPNSPSPSPSPSASNSGTPSPGVSESESVPGTSVSASPSGPGGLPVTGVAVGGMAATALALIVAGVALLAIRRRRELTEDNTEL